MKGLQHLASGPSFCIEALMGKHMSCVTQAGSLTKKSRNGGAGGGWGVVVSAQHSGIIIFSIDSHYRVLSCSKSFVIYPDNDI